MSSVLLDYLLPLSNIINTTPPFSSANLPYPTLPYLILHYITLPYRIPTYLQCISPICRHWLCTFLKSFTINISLTTQIVLSTKVRYEDFALPLPTCQSLFRFIHDKNNTAYTEAEIEVSWAFPLRIIECCYVRNYAMKIFNITFHAGLPEALLEQTKTFRD